MKNELIEIAQQMEEADDFEGALQCWHKIIKLDRNPHFLCKIGRLFTKIGSWSEAEKAFLEAIKIVPDLVVAHDGLALAYLEQGDINNAQRHLKESLLINKSARAFNLLGVTQSRQGDISLARQSFNEALEISPLYEEALYNLAVTYRIDQPLKAIDLFHKSLGIDPDRSSSHRELGWCLRRLGKISESIYHLTRALDLDKSDGWCYIYLGNTLWTAGDSISAESAFKNAIDVWPDSSIPHWCLAVFYEYQGRQQEADFFYEKALQLDPNDPETNFRFGLFLKQSGEIVKAKTYLERVISLDPTNEAARSALSEIE